MSDAMNVMFAGMIGGWEMVLILAVVLVLFGAKKLPELAKGLGTGIKEFKKATRDVQDELTTAMDDSSSRRSANPSYPAQHQVENTTPAQPQSGATQAPQTPQVKSV